MTEHQNQDQIRLLAQIQTIESEASLSTTPWDSDRLVVELALPESLDKVQRNKIDNLLEKL